VATMYLRDCTPTIAIWHEDVRHEKIERLLLDQLYDLPSARRALHQVPRLFKPGGDECLQLAGIIRNEDR
jgi:hypothetical protein